MNNGTHAIVASSGAETARMPTAVIAKDDDFTAVMTGADVGLALFDEQLRMIACNALYKSLLELYDDDTAPGVLLTNLDHSSEQCSLPLIDGIEGAIAAAVARLKTARTSTFQYTNRHGRILEINRRALSTGSLVETVRDLQADSVREVLGGDAHRLSLANALDVMANAFALYDNKDHLIVYNRKFVDSNPHIADLIIPGVAFKTLLREAVRRGGVMLHGRTPEGYIELLLKQHANPTAPYEIQLTDGRWLQIDEKRTSDGSIVSIQSDITQAKLRELELLRISKLLQSRNTQLDAALNNMTQGICLFDAQQKLLVCNRRYLEFYGFTGDVAKPGISLDELIHYCVSLGSYSEAEGARLLVERCDRSRLATHFSFKQQLTNGRIILVTSEPMEDGGTVATYHDITDLEQQEERNRAHTLKLERSNRELEEFAYVASHDLQEPLRKIEAFGDRLQTRFAAELSADGQMFIERMQSAAGRMRRLINDLLSYSRVTTKAKPFQTVDLNTVLTDVLSDLQASIDDHQAKIITTSMPSIPADPVQMEQLFQNMISNSLKFARADATPVIEITATLEASADPDSRIQNDCVIRFADNGIGFDNKYKDLIFKIFQRLHARSNIDGTGVGLATCRKIVERHNGSIDCDGRPNEGATFIIRIPVRDAPAGEVERPLNT